MSQEVYDNLCDVPGVLVGHATDRKRWTGCTAILFPEGATAGVDVRGAAPGTRETDLLQPVNTVQQVHAILLTGGSAFGLQAAGGVMRYLEERGIGFDTRVAKVPIVPAAVLFDLSVGSAQARPDEQMGYLAASRARPGRFEQGNAGAGTGATVGKVLGPSRAMKGGLGSASLRVGPAVVGALVAVNAFGHVVDPDTGKRLAGPRLEDGSVGDTLDLLLRAAQRGSPPRGQGENTTIGVVATNVRLDKAQATRLAQMTHNALARTLVPSHTVMDGDTVFAASVGEVELPLSILGPAAVKVMERAILRAILEAESIPGYPAARDLD